MNLDQIKKEWNIYIVLYKNAEQLVFENPDKAKEYSYFVNELCMKRDYLKDRYITLTEINIPDDIYYNGF